MTNSRPRRARATGLARVAVYYGVLGVALVAMLKFVPGFADIVSGARLAELGARGSDVFGSGSPAAVAPLASLSVWAAAWVAGFSMIGALSIMVPVTWVYMVTRRHRGYDESVVHTMLILPVAVTGIVMIVQDSVALAFSLAGIVAAVRFRTTLDDTKDAVYVFLAIGVGLAAGVQAIGVALTLSLVFNAVVLVLWKTRFGNIYADQNSRSGPIAVGDVMAGPGSGHAALKVGDPAILEAASTEDLVEVTDRAVRFERYLDGEATKKKSKRANVLLLVHATAAESAQRLIDPILEELSTRWTLIEVGDGPSGALLAYLARLDGEASQGAVVDRVRADPNGNVKAAELRSLKGLKSRK